MRTRYNSYPEYHTSLDNLDLVTPSGLDGAYTAIRKCIELLEQNYVYQATTLCEPQLGRRGLYPTLGTRAAGYDVRALSNVLAYADGTRDLVELATDIEVSGEEAMAIASQLVAKGLLRTART
jgi:aminopeptidase-like protein